MNKCETCKHWKKLISKKNIYKGIMDIGLCSKLCEENGNDYFHVDLGGCSNAFVDNIETGSEFCCKFYAAV